MSSRPVLSLRYTPLELMLEFAAGAGLLWTIGLIIFTYGSLPETIPTHFDLGGEPDGWGPRWMIAVLPAVELVLYVILTVMGRITHRLNYPWTVTEASAPRQYRLARGFLGLIKVEIVLFFGYIKFTGIRVALGNASGLAPIFVPIFLAATLGTIAVYLALAYRAR